MNRRRLVCTLAGLPVAGTLAQGRTSAPGEVFDDPYAEVDWDTCVPLHSMSHQHQGYVDASRDEFLAMGYRHFAFSNYYPSAPIYPLPAAYLEKHPEVAAAPNAEHHSFTDSGLHANALGSLLVTGYGSSLSAAQRKAAPLLHRFSDLDSFDGPRPWQGVYRLDVGLTALPGADAQPAPAHLTVEGAVECAFREEFKNLGPVQDRALTAGSHTLYFRVNATHLDLRLEYDSARFSVTQLRLMQGTNRPWRDVFRAALDGEVVDGSRTGGLLHPEGGGITLNHPTRSLEDYAPMLDFDPRVLGIEVWNQLTSGFGSSQGFYAAGPGPHLHFYRLWDDILRTGRRCWGFFVKDHNTYGRGRNVLLVPDPEGKPPAEHEAAALRAYRTGAFFGSVAALAVNDEGELAAPYDRSDFRFTRLSLKRDPEGRPTSLAAAVAGNDPAKRPQVQIRFITDQGVASVADASQAEFPLARDASGRLVAKFVRVEAFAFPATHLGGQPLTPAMLREMNVYDISRLHDRLAPRGATFAKSAPEMRTPVPIVDMIFSQPFRRLA